MELRLADAATPRPSARSTTGRSPSRRRPSTWCPARSRTSTWLAARSGARAAIVAVGADGRGGRVRLAVAVARPARLRHDRGGLGVRPSRPPGPGGRASAARRAGRGRHRPRLPRLHGPHRRRPRRVDRPAQSPAGSRWSAPSGRWAGSSASGSTSWSWSGCSRASPPAAVASVARLDDTFPRQQARTQRFTLGAPRNITVAPDGAAGGVPALGRARGRRSPSLWVLDVASGEERIVADPADAAGRRPHRPAARGARPAGAGRESAAGITGYATDAEHRVVAAALAGQLVVADLVGRHRGDGAGAERGDRPAPRPHRARGSPGWTGGQLWVLELDDPSSARVLAGEDDPEVRWGVAEFVAAEEMGRHRGLLVGAGRRGAPRHPGGRHTRAAVVDRRPRPPRPPADGGRLPGGGHPERRRHRLDPRGVDGTRTEVDLGRTTTSPTWRRRPGTTTDRSSPCTPATSGASRSAASTRAPARPRRCGPTGTTCGWSGPRARPARLADGRVVVCTDARRSAPARGRRHPRSRRTTSTCAPSPTSGTPGRVHRQPDRRRHRHLGLALDRRRRRAAHRRRRRAHRLGGGRHRRRAARLARQPRTRRWRSWAARPSAATVATPLVTPNVAIRHVGPRRLATALCLPHDAAAGRPAPRARRPLRRPARPARGAGASPPTCTSQWFADQGFAVVVIDGRGTPGRGPAWERAIHHDLAGPVLEDQVDGLLALAAEEPRLDLDRVAIRGWSFGGYLAALAVLRRPDVFHAAIAGAPVTDWRLYDTFYTERYLGHPDERRRGVRAQLAAARRPEARAPAAAGARPGRRQRRERPHPAALRGPARGGPARTRSCR